jgi:hypothetical protein
METPRKRRLPQIMLISGLVVLSIYTLYWYSNMQAFQREVATMQSAGGGIFDLQSSATTYSGFPYRLKASFENVEMVKQRSDYTATLKAPQLELTRLMWKPSHMIMTADRPRVNLRSRGGLRPVQLAFSADSLTSSLRITPKKVERLSFEFSKAIWTDGHTLNAPIKIAGLQFHVRESDTPSADAKTDKNYPVIANIRIMAGTLRTGKAAPMNVDLYADLTGNIAFDDKMPMLDIWRQKNGTVALRRFNIVQPDLSWSATGHFSLDRNGLIIGNGKLNTNNLDQTLALLTGKIIAGSIAAAAKDYDWRVADATIQLDSKLVTSVPFQLFDVVQP